VLVSNDSLVSIELPDLVSVGGDLSISENVVLTEVALAALSSVGGVVTISDNAAALLPFDFETAPREVDVGSDVDDAVASVCADPSAPACQGIAALCRGENGGVPCDPVSLPSTFLRAVDRNGDGDTNDEGEDAEGALGDAVRAAATFRTAIAVDFTGLDERDGFEDVAEINVLWPEDTLTFDTPALHVYIGPPRDAADLNDVLDLIADPEFEEIGTGTAQSAGGTGAVAVTFNENGLGLLFDRLSIERGNSATFTIALDAQAVGLNVLAADAKRFAAPQGAAKIAVRSRVVVDAGVLVCVGALVVDVGNCAP
jgi:hypothetical protein